MLRALCWSLLIGVLAACSRSEPLPLASPQVSGELVVLVRAAPGEFGSGTPSGLSGFEVDLVRAFAQSMDLKVQFRPVKDFDELAAQLATQQAHMAIGSLTPDWPAKVRFSIPVRRLHYVLAEHDSSKVTPPPGPRTVGVMPHSPAAEMIRRLMRDDPLLTMLESRERDDMALLRSVAVRRLDMTLTDDLHYALATRFWPHLKKARELPDPAQLVWAFPPSLGNDILPEADAFIERARSNGLVTRLLDRYLSQSHRSSEEDIAAFIDRMGRVLPDYREEFLAAEHLYGVDWRLLAAIAYQESQWDPTATSFTGVRGMMMLTAETADRLGVRDRLDPRQSIRGGARYFAELRQMLPGEITEPDRTWLALAAYNIGPGHMNGALAIARSQKSEISSWAEMKKVLPLLEKPSFAARLKAGAARGGEAVAMAENVRTFYDILKHFQKPLASYIGPRERDWLTFAQRLPKLGAVPRSDASSGSASNLPTTLLPSTLEDLAPEAAQHVRERLKGAPTQPAEGESTSSPPM
jgi:membrane-bound lytic murein transglycosylase F